MTDYSAQPTPSRADASTNSPSFSSSPNHPEGQHPRDPSSGSAQSPVYNLDHHSPGSYTSLPFPQFSRWKTFRLRVMRLATVPRLQILWGLLTLFGTMSWLALMPAFAFRNKLDTPYFNTTYTFFLVATVGTTISALWQSLCPFLVRQSQRSLLPRIINHPAMQTTTILISVILTILNFFSWIILASNKDGAKTDCQTGPLSDESGYLVQCRGVNVAIVLDVVAFLLWIPISIVIVCGTIERGLWWWGEDDGAHAAAIVKGSNMMSEEEFDLKIGGGHVRPRSAGVNTQGDSGHYHVDVQQPKPAFVTPIASQFSSSVELDEEADQDYGNFSPSSYRKHHQHRQQPKHHPQEPKKLDRKPSNSSSLAPSLTGRLSTFFGAGWNSGPMPPPEAEPPMPAMPTQYKAEPSRLKEEHTRPVSEAEQEPVILAHADSYTTQWHSRRDDDWS